jgi:hypothetical protein
MCWAFVGEDGMTVQADDVNFGKLSLNAVRCSRPGAVHIEGLVGGITMMELETGRMRESAVNASRGRLDRFQASVMRGPAFPRVSADRHVSSVGTPAPSVRIDDVPTAVYDGQYTDRTVGEQVRWEQRRQKATYRWQKRVERELAQRGRRERENEKDAKNARPEND